MKRLCLFLNLVCIVQLFGQTTPSIIAEFAASTPETSIGLSVQFNDQSTAQNTTVTSWSWNFSGGSPATSTTKNPTVQYATPGVYTVTLTVSNGSGVSNTKTRTDYVAVFPAPKLDRSYWTVAKASSQQPGNESSKTLDGNLNSIWHTQYSPTVVPVPHEIVYDMGLIADIAGIGYQPRPSSTNGLFSRYVIYVSDNLNNWGTAVASGTWMYPTQSLKIVTFSSKATGRYIRLWTDQTLGSPANTYGSCAEFYAFGKYTAIPASTVNFFTKNQALLTGQWTAPPTGVVTDQFTSGPVLGNGDVAVVAGGTTTTQTLLISKADFITDNSSGGTNLDPIQLPIGGLNIIVNSPATSGYSIVQDIVAAELRMQTATSPQVNIRNWVASGKNVLVSELTNSSPTPVSITVETFTNANDTANYAAMASVTGSLAYATRTTRNNSVTRWTSKAGLTTRILGATAMVSKGAYKSMSAFTLTPGQTIKVVTYVSGGGRTNDAKLTEAATYLNAATDASLVALDSVNKQWWKDYYNKSYVETFDNIVNRYYIAALYELGCTFRTTSPACAGLYGNWITQDYTRWHSDIHLNYNGQAPFYGAFSGNRPEMAMPFFKAIEEYIPEGKRRAQQDISSVDGSLSGPRRGILYTVGIGNWGATTDRNYCKQVVAAPFNVPLFMWYYEHTLDETFLRNRAYPYTKLVGDFLEDYLVKETGNYKDGYRYTITAGAHEFTWNKNSISDLAFTRRVFTSLLSSSRTLGVDSTRRAFWKDILGHLSAYPTTTFQGKQIFAFDDAGWVHNGSNATILLLAHPAETVHLLSPKDSLDIARNTLRAYTVNSPGRGWNNINNFPMAFPMGARIGFDADTLWSAFRGYISGNTGRNLFIDDRVHGMEKAGSIETIHSMMLQSVNNTLLFFPNWMASKPGYFRNLRAKGAFVVSADYVPTKTANISIYSEKGSLCKVRSPWPGKQVLVYENGTALSPAVTGDIYSFPTQAGATYTLAEGAALQAATLYKHCDYGGYAISLPVGTYTLSQLTAAGISNDDVSSVKVLPGYSVLLYENDNFAGRSLTLTSDNACLSNSAFNDLTTSVKIVATPAANARQALEESKPAVTIYPNPSASGYFNVDLSGFPKEEAIQVVIRTATGQVLSTYQLKSSDTQTIRQQTKLGPGIYLVTVQSNRLSTTKKLIVK